MRRRRIHFPDAVYEYFVGLHSILVWAPDGAKHVTSPAKVKGLTPDTVDRGRWKKTRDGEVKPSEVKAWIESNLRN